MKKKYLIKFLSFILAMILFFTDITAYASNMVPQTISGNTLSGNSMSTNTFSMNQIPEKPVYAPYWDGEGNFSNLIIFVEFADTLEEHTYDSEYIKLFEDDSEDGHGLRDHFYDVSKGKMKIETIIPQYDTENKEIVALTLQKPKSEYIDEGVFEEIEFLRDVTEELNNSELLLDEMNLHCSDSESTIADYLTIIVPEDADDPEEIVTSHNGVCESEEILLDENIVHKYDLIIEGDLKSENAERMINNLFWECLGYRNYTGNAGMLYPTADFLASHLSWFEIPELTESQLSYVLTDSDAVILKTALSDTEYFIIEYRQNLSEDEGISDLLIYRVDTEIVFGGGNESERIEIIPYGEQLLYSNGDKSNIALKNVMVTEDNKISIDIIFGNPEKKIVGWQEENGRYCYYNQEGKKQKGIVKIDGKNYYFDDDYQLTTGWKKISGKYRFFNDASNYKNRYELTYTDKGNSGGWVTLSDGRKSYISTKKGVLKGWQTISGKKYYFSSKGIRQSGWQTIDGKKYFFNLSGVYMPMGKTSITSVTSTTYGKAKIQWKKVSYVDDYVLQYSTSSKFKSGSTKTIKLNDASSTTYTLEGLGANKTYYFRIRYTAEGGKKSDPEIAKSKYSAAKSVKVKGEVKATSTSAKVTSCKITAGSKAQGITIYFKAKLSDRLKSADKKYYIVQTESYGTKLDAKTPRAVVDKDFTVKVKFDIAAKDVTRALMDKYALAIKNSDGKYQLVSTPRALANPEFVAENTKAVLKTVSKKGIQGAGFADAADTNSKHTLFNLDLADIVSTKAKSGYVPYQYKGKTYYFSDCSGLKWELQQMARGYDQYIQGMTGKKTKISVTMCILLSYKSSTSFLIDKAARTKGHTYYMLNVREEKARETLEAVFLYLGEIFGQEDCYVTNWVLGNEVNSSRAWNYSGSLSQSQYMKCYASAFRLLYNGVKASKTGNNVHISLDNGWCAAPDTYTGKSTLDKFASYAHKENPSMIWGIAYHGYSYPLTINDFWKDTTNTTSKSSTKYISMKNISVLTKYAASLEKKYEKPSGSIRVILSEQGYNAGKGSYSQAYALARGYYMAEFNSRIDAFIIRALQDAKEETKGGLYFGIKNRYEEKRTSYYVYENMDSDLTKFGKKKASTYVSSANVNKFKEAQKVLYKTDWADIIPKFKKSKLEGMY